MDKLYKRVVIMKTSIILIILIWVCWWVGLPIIVQPGRAEVCPVPIKQAIYKMGPGYDYKLLEDRHLQVWIGQEWLNLKWR